MVVILPDKCEECINRMMTRATAVNQHRVFLLEMYI